MSFLKKISMRAFGQPTGMLGKLGGKLMARMNRPIAEQAIDLLDVQPENKILEIGFGPGVGIKLLSDTISSGWIAGIEPSKEMIEQAETRNKGDINAGKIDLRKGSVEDLPFTDATFDKAVSVNSMPFWPDAIEGLRELRRTIKPGGTIVFGFTYHSGQSKDGLPEIFKKAGFDKIDLQEDDGYFFILANRPLPSSNNE